MDSFTVDIGFEPAINFDVDEEKLNLKKDEICLSVVIFYNGKKYGITMRFDNKKRSELNFSQACNSFALAIERGAKKFGWVNTT